MELFIIFLKNYIIPFLLISTIVLIFILLSKRVYYEYSKPYKQEITNKTENFLTEMILSKPNKETVNKKLLQFKKEIPLHKSWCKKLVINDMIRFKLSLKGIESESILFYYQAFQLDAYSKHLIRDFRNYNKCEGIYHFQALDYKMGIPLIKSYLNHANIMVRSNANMSYISLSENFTESFEFLMSGVSHLNMIKIMDIVHERRIATPKNIDEWIESNNDSVTRLGLKIMVFYNYRNRANEIITLIKNENESIKKEAIIAIRELFLIEAKEDLLSIFDKVSTEIKLEIIISLKVIGDETIIPFLENVILKETNKNLKLSAIECLNEFDKRALDLITLNDLETSNMVKHVREIYI